MNRSKSFIPLLSKSTPQDPVIFPPKLPSFPLTQMIPGSLTPKPTVVVLRMFAWPGLCGVIRIHIKLEPVKGVGQMTAVKIRFQLELEGGFMPDNCIRELAEAKACQLAEVDGETTLIINRQGLEIVKRYSSKPELADQLLNHFPEK